MAANKIVDRDAWLTARLELLEQEKALDRRRDELSAARRALPWVRVTTDYAFTGPSGTTQLVDLFAGRWQLIIYHFMLGTDWEAGCPSCSYLADHFDGMLIHLANRDTSFAAVSIAGIDTIEAYRQRMNWQFTWVSSAGVIDQELDEA